MDDGDPAARGMFQELRRRRSGEPALMPGRGGDQVARRVGVNVAGTRRLSIAMAGRMSARRTRVRRSAASVRAATWGVERRWSLSESSAISQGDGGDPNAMLGGSFRNGRAVGGAGLIAQGARECRGRSR